VKKPTGVKIKTEVEAVKPKVSILPFYLISPFDLNSGFLTFNFVFYFQGRKRNISTETVSTASKKLKQTIELDTEVSTAHAFTHFVITYELDLFISHFLYSFRMMKKKKRKSPL
jgi:hypothetical protein